ncbi:MAG: dihydroorotate dehydrogenase electron transfer subunit [Candidatus Muirbacterium halophilum]|nr:dihydroorotate dehydrogenase electron transfer subunit [Candidatus Muirbacterium halophilum]MCK9476077.1 dihydroorotate dehydrogenase electron transfer subunit [Candidatus Muirbacterium halophilum]
MAERIFGKIKENVRLDIDHFILKVDVFRHIEIKPGQFFMIRAWEDIPVLNRPFSVFDYKDNIIQFFIKIKGKGTELLSKLKIDEEIFLLGPSGNGFQNCENYLAVGAGMGIAPINYTSTIFNLETIYAVNTHVSYMNFSDSEFNVWTLDGTSGEKGNAIDAIKKFYNNKIHKGIIACGPEKFLEYLIKFCKEKNIPLQVSFEEKMACGTGLCMSCAKKVKDDIIKICQDGPVVRY